MIRLPFRISSDSLKETYNRVRTAMSGNENIIFDAMKAITAGRRYPFTPPINFNEYDQKHREIEERLEYPVAGHGIETAMRLMEEIVLRVRPSGGVGRYSTSDLLDMMRFQTSTPRTAIFLTEELHWSARWDIVNHTATTEDPKKVYLDIYSKDMGEIVPSYLVKYIDYSILGYQEKINIVALALLSITIEATLRDVLATKGYSFVRSAATKRVNGLGEALNIARRIERFLNPMILPEDFDEVIKVIRNNLVHLSSDALNTRLPMFDERSRTNTFTLQNFLEDDDLVYDFITNVPRFISGQYNELRRAGP